MGLREPGRIVTNVRKERPSVRKGNPMDTPTILHLFYLFCGFILIFCIVAYAFELHSNRKKDEAAFAEGYAHALEVHGLAADAADEETMSGFTGKRIGNLHADTWEKGYRKALAHNGLAWSERDSQEIWHNPYVSKDRDTAIQNAANTNAMATQNASNTLRSK